MQTDNFILEARAVSKRFPGVLALNNTDLHLRPGTVHGLVGKNGAGKTTLINILSGILAPTEGAIYYNDEKIHIDPHIAIDKGIAVIPQEPRIAPTLTVAENLFLGILPVSAYGFIGWRRVKDRAREVLDKVGLDIDVNARIRDLTVADHQLISTCKAFFIQEAKVVIMDEVTAALSEKEEQMLYKMIDAKKKDGAGIIFISHELDEVFKICDYVTVLRNGRVVATREVASLSPQELVDLIVGEKVEAYLKADETDKTESEVVFSVEGLSYRDILKDISFKVRRKEIIGIAGLRGSGRTELFKAIFGLLPKDRGRMKINAKEIDLTSSNQALREGIFYLPEDREREGILSMRSVKENISICALDEFLRGLGFINNRLEIERVNAMIQRLQVLTPSLKQQVNYLSGGNKQKVILGRGLLMNPVLFLLDEPTKGIDVETKMEIRRMIVELSQHASILLISSEFEDLLAICDRILVMRAGRIEQDLPRQEFTETDLHHYVGGTENA